MTKAGLLNVSTLALADQQGNLKLRKKVNSICSDRSQKPSVIVVKCPARPSSKAKLIGETEETLFKHLIVWFTGAPSKCVA